MWQYCSLTLDRTLGIEPETPYAETYVLTLKPGKPHVNTLSVYKINNLTYFVSITSVF